MPKGESSTIESNKSPKITKILSKLFSFFVAKNHHNKSQNNLFPQEFTNKEIDNDILHYYKLTSEDIMVPRIDIIAVEYSSSLETITNAFLKSRHTRMPVYKTDLDNIVGFINIKDILPFIFKSNNATEFKIEVILRKLLVIPPSMKIFNLLEKMRQSKTHIALVVDELGGTDGLITIEDLIEEFIGELEDEHDSTNNNLQFKKINNKIYEVSGRMEIEELQEKIHINLSSDDINEEYDTLGGLILSISSYVPNKGDKIIHPSSNIIFEIIDSDPRRIKTVRIHLP